MIKKVAKLIMAGVLASPLAAMGADAAEQLRQFVQGVQAATGEFTQSMLTEAGQPGAGGQQGTFSFKRPGKFKWLVEQPYQQLTLSDGKQLYQYDPDLAQVIVRSVDDSVGASPAAILFGSGDLDESFRLSSLPQADGLEWLRAEPRRPGGGMVYVDIGFHEASPARRWLLHSFGKTQRVALSDMVTTPSMATNEFTVTQPADADVVPMHGH